MSAHTPGPWQYKPNSDQIIGPMVVYLADDGACGDNDCCGQPTYWVEIRPEDGRLIAAAPDMLKALQTYLAMDVRVKGPDWYAAMRAAVAKATGAAP